MSERIPINEAMRITGIEKRTLQSLSKRGKVPGAAKLCGLWSYDVAKLRRWIQDKELEACQTSIDDATPRRGSFDPRGMAGSILPAASEKEAYERAIGLRR